ncbi:MAG TPA: ABC transporter permease [Xanthobacteraceae bacterium]|jgi:putative spermidine/putrescine transport system permease protein
MARTIGFAFLAVLYAFLLAPLLYIVIGSFNPATLAFPPRAWSLHSYAAIPTEFLAALGVSLIVAAASACLAIPLGVSAALGVVRGRFAGRDLVNSFLLSPLLFPMLVLGASLYRLYYEVDQSLGTALSGSLTGLILGHTSFCIPYVARSLVPALMQMPASLEEAAYDLGAGRWFTFTRVTLPLMRTGLVGGIAFAFLTSFDNFPMSLFLAEGENATLPVVMFQFIEFDLTPVILSMSTLVILGSLAVMLVVEKAVGMAALVGLPEH